MNSDLATFDRAQHVLAEYDPALKLVAVEPLTGGSSSTMSHLAVRDPSGARRTLVMRCFTPDRAGGRARDEFRLLQTLQQIRTTQLNVPEPLHLWPDPAEVHGNRPTSHTCMLLTYVAGIADPSTFASTAHIERAAATLANIHRIDASTVPFLRTFDEHVVARSSAMRDDPAIPAAHRNAAQTLTEGWPLPSEGTPVLMHGDYWPGNLVWHRDEVACVLDWEDAMVGNALADLANARLEWFWAFGEPAMTTFTDAYLSATAAGDDRAARQLLRWFDLTTALKPSFLHYDWADPSDAPRLRGIHARFLAHALERVR